MPSLRRKKKHQQHRLGFCSANDGQRYKLCFSHHIEKITTHNSKLPEIEQNEHIERFHPFS